MGFWLEVVTLVVPGFNDSDVELGRIAEFLAGISADIAWHVTAFHQDYKMLAPRHAGLHAGARRGHRTRGRAALRLRRQPVRNRRRSRGHALSRLRGVAGGPPRLTGLGSRASRPRTLPLLLGSGGRMVGQGSDFPLLSGDKMLG